MPPSAMLSTYLADLPHGLKSYPACKAKVSVLRSALEVLEVHELDIDPPVHGAGIPRGARELTR